MKNYGAIFLATILTLTAFAGLTNGQKPVDSYFENQVKMSKPAENQSKTIQNENVTAPANDDFAAAETVAMGGNGVSILTRNNISASKEASEPNHADNMGGSSVWFKFTPTVTKAVEIRTISAETTFDTTLAVYRGDSLQSLVLIGSNDDCFRDECGTRSRVRLLLTAGTTYRIAVDGYNNGNLTASGTFKMIMEEYSGAFEFDNLLGAYDLGTYTAGTIGMTNHNATAQAGEPMHYQSSPASKSVWFRYRTLFYRSLTFELTDDNFAGDIAVYASSVEFPTFAQLSRVGFNADNVPNSNGKYAVSFWANPTLYYFIAVDNNVWNQNENQTGNFQLRFFQTKLRYSMRLDPSTTQASLGVFRPSNGTWYSREDVDNVNAQYIKFGLSGDVPVPADYDGDAVSNYAVTRNQNGLKYWYILHDYGSMTFDKLQWGLAGDQEVVGDFNRDGRADPTVVRAQNGQLVWYVAQSPNVQLKTFVFGIDGDRPVLGDFDGDGATDVAVVRWENGGLKWYILCSNSLLFNKMSGAPFGLPTDIVAAEDYDGDGRTDLAVFRPSTGTWYIQRSSTNEIQITPFGASGDKPQPADYDNDGKADLALYRPAEGKWYFWLSASNTQTTKQWGLATDIPVSSLTSLTQ